MKSNIWKADAMLVLTAVLWGAAFVAQRVGMNSVGPFTFNGVRFLLGAMALFPLAWHRRRETLTSGSGVELAFPGYLRACGIAGLFLFTGASLQQIGLLWTTAGNAGFITGLYVVFVPLLGLFGRSRPDAGTSAGVVMAAAGLYFLSVNEAFVIAPGDLLELAGAFFWAGHVLLVGRYAARLEPISFSIGQFLVCGVLSLMMAVWRESITTAGIAGAVIPIAYGGLISVGIGYTLQVVAQKDALPTHAAIILSLEAVFAAWTGRLLLGEMMSWRATGGCALMLAGCLLAQIWPMIRTRAGNALT
ncbi:MAG TPA: DMT family transporter [Candidatus Ozemobacteraceae bacterium]|nr:DMT family transporter [Candidatus Ozemobacteraceae bacterium]